MELDLNQILTLFILFITALFSVYLLTVKSKNRINTSLIVIFLLLNSINSSSSFIGLYVYPNYPGVGMLLGIIASFLQLPILYLFILSTIYSDFKLKTKDLLHLIPFIVVLLLYIPPFFSLNFNAKHQYLKDPLILFKPEVTISYTLLHLQAVFYSVLSFLAVFKYKQLLLENYSNANMFNYRWLLQLVSIFAIIAMLDIIRSVFMFSEIDFLFNFTWIFLKLVILGFICWLVLKALHSPDLFRGISSDMQLVKDLKEVDASGQLQTGVENEDSIHNDKIEELDQFMYENKPYLDASLSLFDLANQFGCPKQELSLLINNNLNLHFFDFINSYRIRLAMEILKDPSKKDLTVLEILYYVGFNSKSSFNTAFKKITDHTPTQYRQKHLPT